MLQFTAQLGQLRETLNKCRNNQLMIYNSNGAAQLTAAKAPAFYWKKQAPAPPSSLAGPRTSGMEASPQLVPTERSPNETRPCRVPDQPGLRFQPAALKGAGPGWS